MACTVPEVTNSLMDQLKFVQSYRTSAHGFCGEFMGLELCQEHVCMFLP